MAKSRLAQLGAKRTDLEAAFESRLRDYQCLAKEHREAGAVMMASYAVEILLKCLICKNLRETELPKVFEEHDLEGLLIMAGLRSVLQSPQNSRLHFSWAWVRNFSEKSIEARYMPDSAVIDPFDFAVFGYCLEDPNCGIVPWLKKQLQTP